MIGDRRRYELPVLAIVLAGGRGSRLRVLTKDRCKPGMPFAKNIFLDFALANPINSGNVRHVMLLTQYMQQGIINHLGRFDLNSRMWGKSVSIYPAQQQLGNESWYIGSADAVYQNHKHISSDPADTVVILAADHIYKIDLSQFVRYHNERGAKFTVCGKVLPTTEAALNFGVMELDEEFRIKGFQEKPARPKTIPGREGVCFASMGIYVAEKKFLLEILKEDHLDADSEHDFGKDIVPKLCASGIAIYGYDFDDNIIPGEISIDDGKEVPAHYWRDVGKIEPYWEAVMDIVAVNPQLNLYNPMWPIPTAWDMLPPMKVINPGRGERKNHIVDIVAAGGCIFDSPGYFHRVIFGRSVRTGDGASIQDSVLFDGADIGAGVSISHTIVEEGVSVPPGVTVGYNLDDDERNGVYIDEDHDSSYEHPPIRIITKVAHFQR